MMLRLAADRGHHHARRREATNAAARTPSRTQRASTSSRTPSIGVAGRRRTQAVLAAIRQQASAASSGRAAPLRLHFTGPSGVGKSFPGSLVANSKFEESRRYTGYSTIGATRATAASVATGAVVAKVSTWGALVAVVSSPIAVAVDYRTTQCSLVRLAGRRFGRCLLGHRTSAVPDAVRRELVEIRGVFRREGRGERRSRSGEKCGERLRSVPGPLWCWRMSTRLPPSEACELSSR